MMAQDRGGAGTAPRPRVRRTWVLGLALLVCGGCSSCPPAWADGVGREGGFIWAAASAGETFVDADSERLALTRAARRLADELGLDVERRLSVALIDDRLFVEAVGAHGRLDDLDALELDGVQTCGGRTHVRVRLARP